MILTVPRSVIAHLRAAAAAAHPDECCGLLLGHEHIAAAQAAANLAATPARRFEIDPAVLLAAHKAARQGGPAVLGYYHSHPNGRTSPSAEDQALAAGDGRLWAIVAAGTVSLWRDCPGGFEALSYTVTDG